MSDHMAALGWERRWGRGPRLILLLAAAQLAACGGGGGGGGSDADLQVLSVATFLSREASASPSADPRTGHRVRFIVRGLRDPERRLSSADVEVRRDGRVDAEARVTLADDATVKSDLTMILDISGSLTASDLDHVKASAIDFVAELLPVTETLRIYEFASPSETRLVGQYEATGNVGSGFAWTPSPNADIAAINGGSNSTALFHAVNTAILADPERDDIIVLFSDGRENSSPPNARERTLQLIRDEKIVVFSVGFGRVDADDMRALSSPFGRFLGVRPSLVGLFDEVGREVRSIYTLVYDTPSSFGLQELDVRIDAEERRFNFETSLLAGIDLARAAIGRFPTVPGSSVTLHDLRTEPPTLLAYSVAPLEEAIRRSDGSLAFRIEPTSECSSPACALHFQAIVGEGAESETGGIYVPALLEEDTTTWNDAVTGEELTFLGFENPRLLNGTDDRRRYMCASVSFPGGTHCFAPEIGLVRTTDTEGNILVELAMLPCLAGSFSGGCVVE